MPYSPGGIYTLPAIYLAIPGTTIIAQQHNDPLVDLQTAQNYARPIIAGGTGANSASLARAALFTEGNIGSKGTNVVSASALAIVANFNYFHVTGSTTITSIALRPAGFFLVLEFEAALIITHNATSLILPNGVNITTAAGDVAKFVSEGSGNWRMTGYQSASIGIRKPPTSQTFTASGTWTKPAGCIRAVFEAVGGGGGSGGVAGLAGLVAGSSGGGGGGAYGSTGFLNVTATVSAALIIGAGGTAGSSAGTAGGAGGDTGITIAGTPYIWGGGGGSNGFTANTSVNSPSEGGTGGTGTSVVAYGESGEFGTSNADNNAQGGAGGSSPFGRGGLGAHRTSTGAVGDAPVGFGAGGGGSALVSTVTGVAGRAGSDGYMRVWEYYG